MSQVRDKNSTDMAVGTVIKDRLGMLVTEQKAALKVWENRFKEQLRQGGNHDLDLQSHVDRDMGLFGITGRHMHTGWMA